MLFAGIDIGTSGVKVALIDAEDRIMAQASHGIAVSAPQPGWSEQHPDVWWHAVCACFDRLAADHAALMGRVAGIGLSGQMLGAVLLGADQRPLRPAILWNDQRATRECADLLAAVPDIGLRTNGTPDPGLTAPKLLWLARHEPQVLAAATMLLLPKDEVRLRLTGEVASEPSDAGGTQLMECATALWDAGLCAAAGWNMAHLPPLVQSWDRAGRLRAALAGRWHLRLGLPVAAGAGDNMACTLGVGAALPGDTVVTIGTSAVLCAVDGAFHPAPQAAVLTAPHAAPGTWLSMGVVMSATATLDWLARLTGCNIATLAPEIEAFAASGHIATAPLMRPSLTGIRTPQNRPGATGGFTGLRPASDRAALGYAVLEGVAFQLAECLAAQRAAGVPVAQIALVGGGARSPLWARLVATLFDAPLTLPQGADLAAPVGAARLAQVAAGAGSAQVVLTRPARISHSVGPDPVLADVLATRRGAWQALQLAE